MWSPLLLVLTASAPLIYAVHLGRNGSGDNYIPKYNWHKPQGNCDLSNAKLPVVPGINFTTTSDRPRHPRALGLGVGVQNYTCTAAGTYGALGAVAQLFDISCLYSTSSFNTLPSLALMLQQQRLLRASAITALALGHHYFVNFNGTLSPRFDITKDKQPPPSRYIIAKRIAGFKAPVNPAQNVDWLQLARISGHFSKLVYRVETAGGQAPATCTPGSGDISVSYAAQYWFFN
ncbi:hypothetical protein BS47DRAFT_1343765 [Hydnum rufescens UP504]|uniref:Malate dehydrogenase n=1 Tax=Hydnum rufescens UP504 TaxID=1448309 RepID=A0A9P6AXD7_9AGAM|nr:hypothetical protein BS47DRAFT_1343765 [Hydnum rufescens UP504]